MQTALALGAIALSASMASAEPNILMVLADDMGLDKSPCHGATDLSMPTLRGLCANGMVFDAAQASPTCSPTRASIMTGKYSFRTGVDAPVSRASGGSLSTSETTLFDALDQQTNYATALIGKWHLSANARDLDHPAKLGVQNFFGPMSGGVKDYVSWTANDAGRTRQIKGYSTSVLTDRAISFVQEQKTPWFLWLAYNAPHTPFHAPPAQLLDGRKLTNSQSAISQNPERYYNAALEALDTELGRLLGSLDGKTRANTIVIFMGDNGTPGRVASAPRGRAKGSLYQGGVSVPLVIAGPSVGQGRSDRLVWSGDLYATILALAGARSAAPDSLDMSAHLQGRKGDAARASVLIEAGPGRGRRQGGWMIRQQNWKLIAFDDGARELYDLSKDPSETRNLIKTQAPKANELIAARNAIVAP